MLLAELEVIHRCDHVLKSVFIVLFPKIPASLEVLEFKWIVALFVWL